MHIALLSDPNNFHTQKWAGALQEAGAQVSVFSFEQYQGGKLNAIRLIPPYSRGDSYSYLSYMGGGKVLRKALQENKVDLVNALNITPFGVWARHSGFRPLVASALGADILEYPPRASESPILKERSWANVDGGGNWIKQQRHGWTRKFYRRQVASTLRWADLITGDNLHLLDKMEEWFRIDRGKMSLLRWGVEEELFGQGNEEAIREQFGIKPGQSVVLSPRGAKSIYQADIILEAFAQLLKEGKQDTHYIMLAAGYEVAADVAAKATQLQAAHSNFRFIREQLPREDLYALWPLVDLFISAPIYDGYSAALAEGRYAGAIPLVNDIPANLELIRHQENGIICKPFTASQLTDSIRQVLINIETYKAKFAPINRDWIVKHSLLARNTKKFMRDCKALLEEQKRI